MKTNTFMVAIASALIGAGSVASLQSIAQHDMHKMGSKTMGNTPSMQMHHAMMSMGKMKMTGDVDRDFAIMMADHHMGAIKMVDVYLKHGKNVQLMTMAKKMKADQTKERAQLLMHAKMKH